MGLNLAAFTAAAKAQGAVIEPTAGSPEDRKFDDDKTLAAAIDVKCDEYDNLVNRPDFLSIPNQEVREARGELVNLAAAMLRKYHKEVK